MFAVSALNSIDSLSDWFHSVNGGAYWSLYRGSEAKVAERIMSYSYETPEDGWIKLSSMVSNLSLGGGQFTIYVGRSDKDSSGWKVRYSTNPMFNQIHHASPQIAGIGSAEDLQVLINKELESFKKDVKIETLEKEIKDLKSGKGAPSGLQSAINGIGEIFENNPSLVTVFSPLITAFASRLMGVGNAQSSMAMAGTPRSISTEGIEQINPEENDGFYTTDQIKLILENLNTIGQALDVDPLDLLEKLKLFCEKNPQMAKSLLVNI